MSCMASKLRIICKQTVRTVELLREQDDLAGGARALHLMLLLVCQEVVGKLGELHLEIGRALLLLLHNTGAFPDNP